jgi:hypothetical protein
MAARAGQPPIPQATRNTLAARAGTAARAAAVARRVMQGREERAVLPAQVARVPVAVAAVAAVAQTVSVRVPVAAAGPAFLGRVATGLPAHQAKVAGVLALVDPTEGTRTKTIHSTGLAAMAGHTALAEAVPVQTTFAGRLAEAE